MQARETLDRFIKPQLMMIPGVAEINIIGGLTRQIHVQPNLQKMSRLKISLNDIRDALLTSNRNAGGAYVREGKNQLLVQASGQFQSMDEIRNLPIKSMQNFTTVKVRDVAEVTYAAALRTGAALVNGEEAVLGTALMLTGANSRTVSQAVHHRVQEINAANTLPNGIKIQTLYNRSDLVNSTLKTVLHNLFVGATLVIIVLFLLLGNLKAALVVSLSIPATLLVTFGLMQTFGISGNLMSLGALDFGILVDGAVIVVDQCVRWIQDRKKSGTVLDKVTGASREIRSAAGFGQIMVIVVFLPILGLGGIEGKMFRPMAQTFVLALLISLVFSFTLIPALTALLFSEKESDREPWLMRSLERLYVPTLTFALQHKKTVAALSAVLLLVASVLFTKLGAEFLPKLDEGSLVLQIARSPQMSLETSVDQQALSEKALLKNSDVVSTFSRLGTPEVATDPMGPHEADTFLNLKESLSTRKEDLITELVSVAQNAVEGQDVSASQPIQMRFNDLLEGTRADLTVKIFGESLNEITDFAQLGAAKIKAVPGSGDVQTEFRGAIPLLEIEPNTELLSKFSLSAGPLLDAIGIGMAGDETGFFYEGLRRIPIVVRLSDKTRNNPDELNNIVVDGGEGLTLQLSKVAALKRSSVPSPILRENTRRRTAVLINPRGRDIQSFVQDAQKAIAKDLTIPRGASLEWTGSFKNLADAKMRMLVLGPLALLLISAMIYLAFHRLIDTLIVLATVPLALCGGVFALYLTHTNFSISAAVGFIALLGIAVLNGVVLVHYFREFQAEHDTTSANWVIKASTLRLRAVLMTALVDVFGFIPMSISTSVGAEVQRPLAVVVIGGILTSTALTLIVLPVASAVFLKKQNL